MVTSKISNGPETSPGFRNSGAFTKNGPISIVRKLEIEVELIEFRKIVSVGETFVIVPKNCKRSPGAPVSGGLERSTSRFPAWRVPRPATSINSKDSFISHLSLRERHTAHRDTPVSAPGGAAHRRVPALGRETMPP